MTRLILLLSTLALFTGCASVSVSQREPVMEGPPSFPDKIYVMSYFTEDAEFNVDREDAELKAFRQETARNLSKALAERLGTAIAPTVIPLAGDDIPSRGWLVTGKFIRVNQGSRFLRMAVGFGAGGTKMETETRVYDLSRSLRTPLLQFQTSGGSNAEPGVMISGVNPLALVSGGIGVIGSLQKGISADTVRTARVITEELVAYVKAKQLKPLKPGTNELSLQASSSEGVQVPQRVVVD